MPKKSVSEKRLAANRANAAHSTGPKTDEGKTRSSQNARKHGFTASKFAVVRLEEIDAIQNLRADAIATYQPVNSQELFAVERIALAQANILRIAQLEAGLFTDALHVTFANQEEFHFVDPSLIKEQKFSRHQNRSLALAEGFHRMVAKSPETFRLFLRYQSQAERLYRRAIEEFERLKSQRSELPIEPIPEPEIEELELYTPPPPEPARPDPDHLPPTDNPCWPIPSSPPRP